ncbi:SdrD B-like domain-containing protein [Corynebacterium sp. CCM 9204]|uniref:DUF7507 domain-containing protein n=1 Tax=Corynebacterium sp. CCM 9204 TaxID=3057616 RepID=UPI003523CFD5
MSTTEDSAGDDADATDVRPGDDGESDRVPAREVSLNEETSGASDESPLISGGDFRVPAPLMTGEQPEGTTVVPGENGAALGVTLTQVSAGKGQEPGVSYPCGVNVKHGFPAEESDETRTDGNVCAGDSAQYALALSKTASNGPATFRINLNWIDVKTGGPASMRNIPTRIVTTSGQNGVVIRPISPSQVEVTFENSEPYSVTVLVNVSASPFDHTETYRLKGRFHLIGTVTPVVSGDDAAVPPASTEPVPLDSDKDLNILRIERFDLGVAATSVAPSDVVINGKSYRAISAQPGITHLYYPGYSAAGLNGKNGAKLPKQLLKYVLDADSLPEGVDPGQVLTSFAGSDPVPANLDEKDPYVIGEISGSYFLPNVPSRYPSFRFFIPTENFPKEDGIEVSSKFLVVDDEHNPMKVRGPSGEESVFPEFEGDEGFGNNEVDPGSNQGKDFATENKEAGIRNGRFYPNNNWVRHTLNLSEYECAEGQDCISTKVDQNYGRGPVDEATGKRAALGKAPVQLKINPLQARDNPRICVAWKPGYQIFGGDKRIHVGWSTKSTPRLNEVYPNARVYFTNRDLVGDGAGEPDCSKDNFVLPSDEALSSWLLADVFGPGTDYRDISGFLIEIDGDGIFTNPTALTYDAAGFNPDKIVGNEEKINGGRYYVTRNYLRVASGDGEYSKAVSDIIYQSTKSAVSVGQMNMPGWYGPHDNKKKNAPGRGRQSVEVRSYPRINFTDGVTSALNGTDENGEPNRFYTRVFLSKCLSANADDLPPGVTYVRNIDLSEDYSDCGISKDHYLERSWLLGDKENTTGDPLNDPALPVGFGERMKRESERLVWRNNEPPVMTANVETPVWALPGQEFPILVESFGTGMRHLKDPAAESSDRWVPRNYIDPEAYYPGDGNSIRGTILVPRIDVLSSDKSVVEGEVSLNSDVAFITTVSNNSELSYPAFEYIDVLPYNGDERGTNYHGTYALKSAERLAGDQSDVEIYYTTDDPAKVSGCPESVTHTNERDACVAFSRQDGGRAIDAQPSADTTWNILTPDAIAAQHAPGGKRITALKYRGGALNSGDSSQIKVILETEGNHNRDVYVNAMGVTILPGEGKANPPIPGPASVRAEVYSGQITGVVYKDVENTGGRAPGDDPYTGVTVSILRDGKTVATTTTDEEGAYDFDNLVPGDYTVRIMRPEGTVVTQSGPSPANAGQDEVRDLVVPADHRSLIEGIDFGLFEPHPVITLKKTVNDADTVKIPVGGTASFTVTGGNVGDTVLNNVRLTDDWSAGDLEISCVISNESGEEYTGDAAVSRGDLLSPAGATLSPGDTYTCAATYVVTQADIDARESLINRATITGDYNGISASADDAVTVTLPDDAEITIVKSVRDQNELYVAGDEIIYEFRLSNTGSLTLHDVTVADPLLGDTPNDCPDTLDPGAEVTCSAQQPYIVTESDATAKKVENTATVTAKKPVDNATVQDESTVEVATGQPGLSITKESNIAEGTELRAADTIVWTVTVTNTGDTPVENIHLSDPDLGDTTLTCGVPGLVDTNGGKLDVGQSATCTAETTVRQEQVDAETDIVNTATVTGGYRAARIDELSARTTVPVTSRTGLTVDKTVPGYEPGTIYRAGDEVTYAFTVTNTGDVSLRDITVVDTKLANAGGKITCENSTLLAPGENRVCFSGVYVVTAEEAAAGSVVNTATVRGTTPIRGTEVTSEESVVSVPAADPRLVVTKTADSEGPVAAGESVTFTVRVQNSGNADIENLTVTDQWLQERGIALDCGDAAALTGKGITLPVGEERSCTAKVPVTTTDIVGDGDLVNTATAAGTVGGRPVQGNDATATVTLKRETSITVNVDVIDPQDSYNVGDSVSFTSTVTNTGDVPLTDITVTGDPGNTITCPQTTLAPGESMVCTSEHVITAEDAKNGVHRTSVTATGTIPQSMDPGRDDRTVSDSDSAEVKVKKEDTGSTGSSEGGMIIPIPVPVPVPGGQPEAGATEPVDPVDTVGGVDSEQSVKEHSAKDGSVPGKRQHSVGGLPVTGANVVVALGIGALLLLVGFGLVVVARRRRRNE